MTPPSRTNLICDTNQLAWAETAAGIESKEVAEGRSLDHFRTQVLRLAPGASPPPVPDEHGMELVVLEGALLLAGSSLRKGAYARRPKEHPEGLHTEEGCTLYVKTGVFARGDVQVVTLDEAQLPWSPGHGNLGVKSLHSFEGRGTALVHWPPGERFLPHQHWGGEEIMVLSGIFLDEHGRYPAGTWIQSPHLSQHHPYVIEETVILVKTGHLPMG
ncbi:MAG: hypothetical protein ACI9F9_000043 [Candidatus Paceibacteria bacterium]|jgi:hypothetical protein